MVTLKGAAHIDAWVENQAVVLQLKGPLGLCLLFISDSCVIFTNFCKKSPRNFHDIGVVFALFVCFLAVVVFVHRFA